MRPWFWLTLCVFLSYGLAEPNSVNLGRIIGLVTGKRDPAPINEDDIADSEGLAEDDGAKSVENESIEDDGEDYVEQGNVRKPPSQQTINNNKIPIPIPPPLSLPPPLLPPLFHTRETIFATKTLFAEVTKKITRHPVCMTVYGVKPPCHAPQIHSNYNYESDYENREGAVDDTGVWSDELVDGFYIEPTATLNNMQLWWALLMQLFLVVVYCEEATRDARWLLGRKITTTKLEHRTITEITPSSCIMVAPDLPPCRELPNLKITPTASEKIVSTLAATMTDASHDSPHQVESSSAVKEAGNTMGWQEYLGFATTTITNTVIKSETRLFQDPGIVVTFSIVGCQPSQMPFDLDFCKVKH